MTSQQINTEKGPIDLYELPNGSLKTAGDFLDIMMNASSETIALNKSSFANDFFDLKTGLAGEIFQKVSNYQRRLIILGDFKTITSKSFSDLIYECNKIGKIIFCEKLQEGIKLLK